MSQTETLLLVVLGFSLGGVVFLFIGRFIWNLALKIGSRRMQKLVPASVAELRTERDRLRADYAILSQKLTQRLETAKLRMAEQLAESTRNRNRLQELTITLNERDAAIVRLQDDVAELTARITASEETRAALALEVEALRSERDQQAQRIGEIEASLAAAEDRLAELAAVQAAAEVVVEGPLALPAPEARTAVAVVGSEGIKARIEALTALSRQIAESRKGLPAPDGAAALPDSLLQEKLDQAARETEDLQKELARLDAVWSARLGELEAEEQGDGRPARSVANVINLANRIKALQKDVARP